MTLSSDQHYNSRIAKGRVDVAPIREAVEMSDLTLYEVSRRVGWFRKWRGYRIPDSGRLSRALGRTYVCGSGPSKGKRHFCRTIDPEIATKILEAVGLDPVDIGL